jgi:hypothetical protein
MKIAQAFLLPVVVAVAACGGSSTPAPTAPNVFLGTLTISSALPTGTTSCLFTHLVTFTSAGVDQHTVTAAGGECLQFKNSDSAAHQPASIGTPACTELNGPVLTNLQTFTAGPLSGPKTCNWQDLLNPPGSAGGGY